MDYLLADKAYDTDAILAIAKSLGIEAVIPPKKNRKEQRYFDREIYRLRCLVENAFLHLKKWRGIATRYAKTQIPSSLPCIFVAWQFGFVSRDDSA